VITYLRGNLLEDDTQACKLGQVQTGRMFMTKPGEQGAGGIGFTQNPLKCNSNAQKISARP
jgi:hypothetical protein